MHCKPSASEAGMDGICLVAEQPERGAQYPQEGGTTYWW